MLRDMIAFKANLVKEKVTKTFTPYVDKAKDQTQTLTKSLKEKFDSMKNKVNDFRK